MKATKLIFITLSILGCVVTQINQDKSFMENQNIGSPSSILGSKRPSLSFNEQKPIQTSNVEYNQKGTKPRLQFQQFLQQQVQPVRHNIVFPAKIVGQNVAKAFDASTQKLNDLKTKLIKEIQQKYLTFGLSSSERSQYEAIRSGKPLHNNQNKKPSDWDDNSNNENILEKQDDKDRVKRFKGSRQHQIISCKKIIAKIQSDIQGHLSEFDKQIDEFFKKTQKSVQKLNNQNYLQEFDDSKILKTDEFVGRINKFFDEKISSAKLIYSGSRDGFAASQFHKRCDHQINTLTVVKNNFDKVFGGFTVLPWDSSATYGNDISFKSFVYQLNQNEKLTLVKPQSAIYRAGYYGPIFGGGHDIYIADNSNNSFISFANIGSSYSHPSYPPITQHIPYGARVRFSGAYNFKVVELQVWKLTFDKKCQK